MSVLGLKPPYRCRPNLRQFLKIRDLRLCLPESVKIAVRISGYNLVAVNKRKLYLRLAADGKFFPLSALLCFKSNPENAVFTEHGMSDIADANRNSVTLNLNDGDMLFLSRVNGVGNDFFHLFAAAFNRNALVFNKSDYVAAV